MNREDLSEVGEYMYEGIVGKEDNHPLERYIYAIDNNIGDEGLLEEIAKSIGLFSEDVELYDSNITLPETMRAYLDNETNVEDTRRKMNMTYEEFVSLHPGANRRMYEKRLLL